MATEAKKPTMAMFDTVAGSNKGAEIELHTTSGDPSGVIVRLLGPDSDEALRAAKASRLRNFQLHQKKMSNRIDDTHDEIERLVAVTTGWENMPSDDGKPRAFSKDAARTVYTDYPSIRRELLEELDNVRNFTKS